MNLIYTLRTFLQSFIPPTEGDFMVNAVLLVIIALIAAVTYYITRLALRLLAHIVLKTEATWDDILFDDRLLSAISQVAPAIAVKQLLPALIGQNSHWFEFIMVSTSLYVLGSIIYLLCIAVSNSYYVFRDVERLRKYAIKGIFQMVKLIMICVGIIIGISIILGRDPGTIFAAIGASAAVLMLAFKDSIMGLVASVHLSANRMLENGDWITCDRHDINGEVEDVSLTTIKVRNWDNSISTIHPYTLITDSFRNYQAMRRSGGRRVQRAVLIDLNSVRFLTPAELQQLQAGGWLDGIEIPHPSQAINTTLLRLYLQQYLARDPRVNQSMLHMVRQLEPGAHGLPMQLYFFTNVVAWADFERIQSDIFDHVYATVQLFGLRIFQSPAGHDLEGMKQ